MSTIIGQQLRQAREARQLTLEQVSRATFIRPHYIQALEAGEFGALPSVTQTRGFLRTYAGFLGLDVDGLIAALDEQTTKKETGARQANDGAAPEAAAARLEPAPGAAQAQEIFKDVGQRLQKQRELLGLSLEDVERHTHLRRHYLQALEAGSLADLPSPVQGRGMLHNYAAFLGLDPEPLLLRFADGLQAGLPARPSASAEPRTIPLKPQQSQSPGIGRRIFSLDFLSGIVLLIAFAGFIVWGALRIFSLNSQGAPTPTARSIADILLATATPSETPTPGPTSTAPLPTLPAADTPTPADKTAAAATSTLLAKLQTTPGAQGRIQVYITVIQRAWLRATVDGKKEFEGRVLPGSAYSFIGDTSVEILTGNAGGLQIFFNNQDLGTLGVFGQSMHRVFTQEGVLPPTPTTTPTASNTPRTTRPVEATATVQLPAGAP
jgi:cytoskeleton protein RodZ